MRILKTSYIRAAALVALAAACRPAASGPRTAPTPALPAVERAPLPEVNPRLPATPEVRGPIRIHVQYPAPNQMIESRDSNFIFGTVGTGDAGLKINGVLVPVWPNGSFMGWVRNPPTDAAQYDLVAANGLETARLIYPVRLRPRPSLSRDSVSPVVMPRDTVTPVSGTVYALLGPAVSAVNDTDRVVIGRPAPGSGQAYKWFLIPGTAVRVTGYQGDFARIELDSGAPIWIPRSDMRLQGEGFTPAMRQVSAAARVSPSTGWTDLVLPVGSPPPFLVEETERSISLLLYGTTAASPASSLVVPINSDISSVQISTEPGRVRYSLNLTHAPYGHLALWENGSFTLRVRRPPVIADAQSPLRGLTITVDPGHPPVGATGPSGLYEAEATLNVGLRLRELLLAKGVNVVMTRTTPAPVELGLRPIISRRANAHAFVSIHLNAFPDGVNPFPNNGTTTYYFWPHSLPLGQATQPQLVATLGLRDIGTKFGNFAVMRGSWMPSILCEGLFIIMPDQEAAIRTPQYQDAYARGILAGLESYFASLARNR